MGRERLLEVAKEIEVNPEQYRGIAMWNANMAPGFEGDARIRILQRAGCVIKPDSENVGLELHYNEKIYSHRDVSELLFLITGINRFTWSLWRVYVTSIGGGLTRVNVERLRNLHHYGFYLKQEVNNAFCCDSIHSS